MFVLGLTEPHREELESVRGADRFRFHPLLDHKTLVVETNHDFDDLLRRARAELDEFGGSVDAIVCHWDFPSSMLAPILAQERGIPAPTLTSMLQCEHKYWSRLMQREAVPEVVPGFAAFDPFDDDALDSIDLPFPCWVKPVKAHSSSLGFQVRNEEDFRHAVAEIRQEITDIGDAFNQVLSRVDLPEQLRGADGNTCLAEEIVTGIQVAPEGVVTQGQFSVHGVVDMLKDPTGRSLERLDYPAASVPPEVQQKIVETTERLLRHIGFDNGAFNAEYMWDEQTDRLRLIEVNTRISQSHSDLFLKVDGTSNHEVAIDVALGETPHMPRHEGPFKVAAQWHITRETDGIVRRVPDQEEIAEVERSIAGTKVSIDVAPGDQLSELPHQDSYRFRLGDLYLGAENRDELAAKFQQALQILTFEFDPVEDE